MGSCVSVVVVDTRCYLHPLFDAYQGKNSSLASFELSEGRPSANRGGGLMLAATVHSLRNKHRGELLEAYTAYCAHEPSLPLSGFLTFADSFDISSYLSAERVADIFEQVISTPARRGGKGSISFEEFKEAICLCALAVSAKQWQALIPPTPPPPPRLTPPLPSRPPLLLIGAFAIVYLRRSSTPPRSACATSTGVPTPTSRTSHRSSSRRTQPPPPTPSPSLTPSHTLTRHPRPRIHSSAALNRR